MWSTGLKKKKTKKKKTEKKRRVGGIQIEPLRGGGEGASSQRGRKITSAFATAGSFRTIKGKKNGAMAEICKLSPRAGQVTGQKRGASPFV